MVKFRDILTSGMSLAREGNYVQALSELGNGLKLAIDNDEQM